MTEAPQFHPYGFRWKNRRRWRWRLDDFIERRFGYVPAWKLAVRNPPPSPEVKPEADVRAMLDRMFDGASEVAVMEMDTSGDYGRFLHVHLRFRAPKPGSYAAEKMHAEKARLREGLETMVEQTPEAT